ncbi:MAG TPA: DsbA family oxidoreductase [Longimicrobiaceae bacterium]|jgi:predicted DsbA family dithiol-disulfide isomerase|nr:DsbA family oxidoreductase [Longimicrobiaceae bacterium]
MKIELFADIACPWCYIGERRLRKALEDAGVDADVVWRPYQLQPGLPRGGMPWAELVEKKFGGAQRAAGMFAHVASAGAPEGIEFRFDRITVAPSTRDSHRLMMLAGEHGRTWEMAEALFRAYFTDGKDVTRGAVLVEAAKEAGIDAAEAWAVLGSDRYEREVDAGQGRAADVGVQGVPFYVFDGKYALSGAQPPAVFADVLRQVATKQPTA